MPPGIIADRALPMLHGAGFTLLLPHRQDLAAQALAVHHAMQSVMLASSRSHSNRRYVGLPTNCWHRYQDE